MYKSAGLISMGVYLPGKTVSESERLALSPYLEDVLLPASYKREIEFMHKLPGSIECLFR
jgi:hypothetical protein